MQQFDTGMAAYVAEGAAKRNIPISWSATAPTARNRRPAIWVEFQGQGVSIAWDYLPNSRGRVRGGKHEFRSRHIGFESWKPHAPTPWELMIIDFILDEYAVGMSRQEQLAKLGYSNDHPPLWAVTVHAAAVGLFGRERLLDVLEEGSHGKAHISQGRLKLSIEHENIRYQEDGVNGQGIIYLTGQLDDAQIAAAPGKAPREVIDHARLEALSTLQVISAENYNDPFRGLFSRSGDGPIVALTIEDAHVLLAEPPQGVIPQWLPSHRDGQFKLYRWAGNREGSATAIIDEEFDLQRRQSEALRAAIAVADAISDILEREKLWMDVKIDQPGGGQTIGISGLVTSTKPMVVITRGRHPCEKREAGRAQAAIGVGKTLDDQARRFVAKAVVPGLRLMARDAQLIKAGIKEPERKKYWGSDDPRLENQLPPWAYAIDPILLAILRDRGFKPEDIVSAAFSASYNSMQDNSYNRAVKTAKGADIGITTRLYEVAVICYEDVNLDEGVYYDVDKQAFELRNELPEILTIGLTGKKLSEVISMPALDGLPQTIAKVTPDRVKLKPFPLVTVAPVPRKLGKSWIELGGADMIANLP